MLYAADSGHAFPCTGRYEPGSFYEIDHEKLPPKSPIQLKAIRVVMVSETTLLGVTVSFPSTLALRSYFAAAQIGNYLPELDERFVTSSNQAGRILRWRISFAQLVAGKHLKSFWLLAPASVAELPLAVGPVEDEVVTKPMKRMGSCLLALKCAGNVGWGVRRKVKYFGRHCELAEKVEAVMEERHSGNGRKRNRDEVKKNYKKKVDARESKSLRLENEEGRCLRGTKDRWSTERYEAAKKRLLEIMKSKGAELGRPILRPALREEARKHIGDTGLLDHLLKHMAGKIVSDGTERFRRRHNSEGAMEYWLEPADLVEVRRKAGITDTFWVPPPGWKLGDSIFPDCKLAIADCKQQLAAQFKRYHEQQISLKKLENQTKDINAEWEKAIRALEEKYQILLKWKRKQEEEFAALLDYVQELKDDVHLLKRQKRRGVEHLNRGEMNGTANDVKLVENEVINGCAGGKKEKCISSSGFRICNPQGIFLWPSMTGSSAASADAAEEKRHVMVFPDGGPPSASSSTISTPKLQLQAAPGLTSPGLRELEASVPTSEMGPQCSPWAVGMMREGNHEDDALAAAGSPLKKYAFRRGGITTDLNL